MLRFAPDPCKSAHDYPVTDLLESDDTVTVRQRACATAGMTDGGTKPEQNLIKPEQAQRPELKSQQTAKRSFTEECRAELPTCRGVCSVKKHQGR